MSYYQYRKTKITYCNDAAISEQWRNDEMNGRRDEPINKIMPQSDSETQLRVKAISLLSTASLPTR